MSNFGLSPHPHERSLEIHAVQEIMASIPACDFHERNWCSKQQARWIARVSHECGTARAYLICEPCKEFFIQTEESFECRACGGVVTPVRHLFSSFDFINGP